MNKKNSIDKRLGVLAVKNNISVAGQNEDSPNVLSRRRMMGILAVAGMFSVLDKGCLLESDSRIIPIGFEPFKEGEKKEWSGPDKPVDSGQMNSFLKKVLPGMIGKAGEELFSVCSFGLLNDEITLEGAGIPVKENGDPALELFCEDGVVRIVTKGWDITITHDNGSICISGVYNNNDVNSKAEYFCDGDDNFAYFDSEGVNYVEQVDENDDITRFFIKDYESILRFLKSCNNPKILEALLQKINEYKEPMDFSGISDKLQIREILRLVPEKFGNKVLLSGLRYEKNDRDGNIDEYRDPITTLQSGWGDCDDYTVLNATWIYAHGYTPFIVDLEENSERGCSNILPREISGHVFEFYTNTDNQTVVCDNSSWSVLDESQTIYDYIAEKWPEMVLEGIRGSLLQDGVLIFEL